MPVMRTLTVSRTYYFESAHFLPNVPDTHKCKRLHGHHYQLDVTVGGDTDQRGFIIDFWDLDRVLAPLIEKVDHRLLNEITGLGNPTAEYIAHWFADRLETNLPHGITLTGVTVHETPDCKATLICEDFKPFTE